MIQQKSGEDDWVLIGSCMVWDEVNRQASGLKVRGAPPRVLKEDGKTSVKIIIKRPCPSFVVLPEHQAPTVDHVQIDLRVR